VVLIDGNEPTACGMASPVTGPFYCPLSERIYVDLSFIRAIHGELARAYVIAHELGHHVQKLTGELGAGRAQADIELEADCYAGVWMRDEQTSGHLQPGDFDAALAEAAAVGDDRLSPSSPPETWTHGSSAQRAAALRAGFNGGTCQ
jgi:predicted metalloprotease